MGALGYKAYRYKSCYYVKRIFCDVSYSSEGLNVLHEIPRGVSKEEFEEWVKLTIKFVKAKIEVLARDSDLMQTLKGEYETKTEDVYVYEIDLDHLVFLIYGTPMFRLDNMPPDDVFLKSISYDHFGHVALHELTPIQFRYNWHPPPPPPRPESLIAYRSCPNRSSTSSIHELLGTPMALSSIERTRTAFVGPLITLCMIEDDIAREIRHMENIPDRSYVTEGMHTLALSFVNFAVGPPNPSLECSTLDITWDFIWIRKDVCLRITTHLDDEQNLQASIGDLVHHINETHTIGTFYGIACSIFHCAIVRLDKDEQGASFAHTPALQFMPSFYARVISTPGIEALSRLGCRASGVEFLEAIADGHFAKGYCFRRSLICGPSKSVASRVPVEVWRIVGDCFTSATDLVNLAYISPQALSAAADLARYPWVLEYRLVDVVGSISPIPETTEDTDEEEIRGYYHQLGLSAQFTAVTGGRRVTVKLDEEWDYTSSNILKVKSYWGYKFEYSLEAFLHVLELDDDEAI